MNNAPTCDEVLAVLTEGGHVYSLSDIVDRVWWKRGGVGSHRDSPRERVQRTRVPVPSRSEVKQRLVDLIAEGVVVTAEGSDADALGSVWGSTRYNGRYYTLATLAQESKASREKLTQAYVRAQQAVLALRELAGDRITDIGSSDSSILLRLTVEQAYALLDGDRPRDKAGATDGHGQHTEKIPAEHDKVKAIHT